MGIDILEKIVDIMLEPKGTVLCWCQGVDCPASFLSRREDGGHKLHVIRQPQRHAFVESLVSISPNRLLIWYYLLINRQKILLLSAQLKLQSQKEVIM